MGGKFGHKFHENPEIILRIWNLCSIMQLKSWWWKINHIWGNYVSTA